MTEADLTVMAWGALAGVVVYVIGGAAVARLRARSRGRRE